MDALQELSGDKYRQDIISNSIGEWIVNGQSHCASKGASVKPLCQNTGPHPNALEKCLMITPSSYILEGTHLFLTL